MANYWYLLIGILIGIVASMLVLFCLKKDGLLRIHWDEDENKPYLFVELEDAPEKLVKRRFVIFRVKEDARQ